MSFAYAKKADVASTSTTPTGWANGWTFPTADGPWPPGWPLEAEQDSPDPDVSEALENETLSVVVTLPSTITIDDPATVEAETQNNGAATALLDNHLLKVTASDGTSAVNLKKTEGGTFASALFYQVENYTGSKYGIQESVYFDLVEADDDATITVTVEVISVADDLSGTDSMTAEWVVVVTAIVTVGGSPDKDATYLYTVSSDSWETSTNLPESVSSARMVNFEAVAYLTGGSDSGTEDNAYSYTLSTEAWSALTDMTAERSFHATWLLDGQVFAALGDTTDEAEAYTIATSSWALKAATSYRASSAFAAVGANGYAFGGLDAEFSPTTVDTGVKYSESADSYSATGTMATSRQAGVAFTDETDIWVTSGQDNGNNAVQTTEQYSVSGDSFSASTSHPNPTRKNAAAGWTTTNGHMVGGVSGITALADNDVFNLSAETWSAGSDLPAAQNGGAGSGV